DPQCMVGDVVEFDAEQNGKWHNGKNFKVISVGQATPISGAAQYNGSGSNGGRENRYDPETEARIMRQNATGSASLIVGAFLQASKPEWTLSECIDHVVQIAKELYQLNKDGYDRQNPA